MLLGIDGFELCRQIRERHSLPVIMLTARDDAASKVEGLALGADDYMTKPFLPLELVARVRAQIRRRTVYDGGPNASGDGLLVNKGLVMDVAAHTAVLNERPLSLTPTEFEILRILLEANGSVVSAQELYQGIFGDSYYQNGSGSITVHVRHLREKMGDSFGRSQYVRTVWGLGYKIDP